MAEARSGVSLNIVDTSIGSSRRVKSETLASAGLVSLIGSAFGAVCAMVLTVVVGRGAGASATGLFFQAIGLFTVATQVLKLGTNSGVIRQLSADRGEGRRGYELRTTLTAVLPVTVIGVVTSGIFFVGAEQIARLAAAPGQVASLADTVRVLAPFAACAAVLGVLQSVTRMLNSAAMFVMLQNILLPLARLSTVLFAVLATWSATGLLLAWAAPMPVFLIITVALLIRPLARDRRNRVLSGKAQALPVRTDVIRFWRFTAPRGVGAALEVALDWADILIVAALTDPRTAGIYAVVTRVVRSGQVVDRAMRIAVSPRISQHLALGDTAAARSLHTKVARAMILATWPFYLTLACMGSSVLAVFGEEFRAGSGVLTLYAVIMMGAAAAGMLQSVLLMGGRSSWQVYIKALALSISIGGNLLLVPRFQLVGAATTWACVVVVDTVIAAILVHRGMGVAIELRRVLPAAAFPLLTYGTAGVGLRLFTNGGPWTLLLYLVAVSAVYLLLLWRYRGVLGIEAVWRVVTPRRLGRQAAESSRGVLQVEVDA